MANREIILFIRRSKEYSLNGTIDREWIATSEALEYNLLAWNLFFKFPYIKFRKRLAEIASLSYRDNAFSKIYLWSDFEDLTAQNSNAIVVPVDEDDWLGANLVNSLTSFDIGPKKAVKWDVITIDYTGQSRIEKRNICRSCAYAVQMPYPQEYIKVNVNMSNEQHRLDRIHATLACKVDNLASISFLWLYKTSEFLEKVKNNYFVEKTELLKDYWYLIDLYNELLNDFYKSCKL